MIKIEIDMQRHKYMDFFCKGESFHKLQLKINLFKTFPLFAKHIYLYKDVYSLISDFKLQDKLQLTR